MSSEQNPAPSNKYRLPEWILERARENAEAAEKRRRLNEGMGRVSRWADLQTNPHYWSEKIAEAREKAQSEAQTQADDERRKKKEGYRPDNRSDSVNPNGSLSPTINTPGTPVAESTYKYQTNPLPKWYLELSDKNIQMKNIAKNRPQALSSLEALKGCIARCEQAQGDPDKRHKLYEELRDYVHKAEIKLEVNGPIIKKARILSPESGLPRIFAEDAQFPSDLKCDSYQLYNRWYREDFNQDILRGIVPAKKKDRNADRLDAAYKAKFATTAKYYGEGSLVLGQWWPTQLCAVRDGAHGAAQGGIYGETDKGAYSIVLSSGGYHDQDDGDVIEYSGTEGKDYKPTDATLSMVTSAELANEIRVIRSSQLPKKNKYRPEVGLRYDDLYLVKGFVVTDKEKQVHRFRLERCPGQEPIRCRDDSSGRPTIFEIEEYRRLKLKDW